VLWLQRDRIPASWT